MADKKDNVFEEGASSEEMDVVDIFTLTDEDDNETDFQLIDQVEYNGAVYYAMVPLDADGNEAGDEYVILKCITGEDGELMLESVDDDEEFNAVADIFDDKFADIVYDD